MPLKEADELKITKNYKDIITGIAVDKIDILDSFIQEGVFSLDDMDRVNSKATTQDKNREFVRLLVRGNPIGYKAFIDYLKKDDSYSDLANKIESTEVTVKSEEPKTIESWIGTDRITLEKKKAQLSDLHLLHFSKALNPAHLNIIGTSFEFSQVDVQNIEYKHNRAPEAASHDLLVKWRNKKGNSATVGCLLENMLKSYEAFPQSIHEEKVRDAVDRL